MMIQRRYVPLWGEDLVTLRQGAGLTQAQLATRAAVSRPAVSTWERKARVDLLQPAPARILAEKYRGCSPELLLVLALARACASWALTAERAAQRAQGSAGAGSKKGAQNACAELRASCAARTRKGAPCRMLSEPGAKRCKFHGGMSTGPRTPEGRARVAEAQRRRWSAWRAAQQTPPASGDEANE